MVVPSPRGVVKKVSSIISSFVLFNTLPRFVQTIEWLPSTHKNSIQPQTPEKEENPAEQERKMSTTPGTPSKARGQLKKILSQVSITAHLHVLRPTTVPDADLPPPPPLSLSPYQLVSGTNPSIAAAAAASGGGLASDEINLKLPLHETSLGVIKPLLEFLMTCYAVEMVRETVPFEKALSGPGGGRGRDE